MVKNQGRIQKSILGANQVLQSKPWSRGRNARYSRAKPELKARSVWELRAKSEEKQEEGSGEGLGETLPRKVLKNRIWNYSFGCILKANIWNKWQLAWFETMFNFPLSWKIDIEYLIFGNCLFSWHLKHRRGSWVIASFDQKSVGHRKKLVWHPCVWVLVAR